MRKENLVRFGAVSVALAMAAGAFMVGCSDDASSGGTTPAVDSGTPAEDGSTPVADSSTPATDGAPAVDAARDAAPVDAGPPPVTKLHVVHAAATVGPVALCLGGAIGAATAAPTVWPDVVGGALSGGKASAPLPQAFGTSLTIPASVVQAASAATVVVYAYPLTTAQFQNALAFQKNPDAGVPGDMGAVGRDCATLFAGTTSVDGSTPNGGVELGRISAGTITAGTAFVAAAVDVPGVDGGATKLGLKVTKMDSAAPATGQVGVHFLHHALNTLNPQTGAQLSVAVGALGPASDAGACPYAFNKFQAATFPDKAPAKADVPPAVFAAPGVDGGVGEGRFLAIGVDSANGVGPFAQPSVSTPCGFGLFPFDGMATLSRGGQPTPAATYFAAGKTYSIIAIGDVTKAAQPMMISVDGGVAQPNPLFFSNWFRFLAFANN